MTTVAAEESRGVSLWSDDGHRLPLDAARWHGEPSPLEHRLLVGLAGPVLDVGCGPGRMVAALAQLGVAALGVDPAPGAVGLARRRGARVLQRSVFDLLPAQGRWRSVLLLDGNLGIGGDPVRLLRRCRALAAPGGTIVAEVQGPGQRTHRCRARLERERGHGSWFLWAVVGADAVAPVAAAAGLHVARLQHDDGEHRWLAHLVTPGATGEDQQP
ncbi:MAG: class I SAM-dependent methyltransferase [Actinobacteria bacterium]|nr:class I SAM-dependent methyltransferase [Actinomycetota bacterium]